MGAAVRGDRQLSGRDRDRLHPALVLWWRVDRDEDRGAAALIATFAQDAMANDIQREFWGIKAIKEWAGREIIEDRVTMDPVQVTEHYGEVIVTARMDGAYDKTPFDGLFLTYYFTARDGKIVRLIIIRNKAVDEGL